MKPVNAICLKIQVCEDAEYKQHLCVIEPPHAPQPRGLYRVESRICEEGYPVFVLAEDESGAISQATDTEVNKCEFTAERVPFLIRGWGYNKF